MPLLFRMLLVQPGLHEVYFMSQLDVSGSVPDSRVCHILSLCPLAATGLATLAGGITRCLPFPVPEEEGECEYWTDMTNVRLMVVFIPDDPYWLLATLRRMASLLSMATAPVSVLLLSRCPASWLWRTLRKLVIKPRNLSNVYAAGSDLPCSYLAALLRGRLEGGPLLAVQADSEEKAGIPCMPGLNGRELSVMLDVLGGHNIRRQVQGTGLSCKTLYNYRISGLKKMAGQISPLNVRFPGDRRTVKRGIREMQLSTAERELVQAIHGGQIFAVYQPVVDREMRLLGFEILCRWYREGQILLPGAFLPGIRARNVWLLLTAFMLQEATRQVNYRQDGCYFSVNIPAVLAGDNNLSAMMATARGQLIHPGLVNCLALEIAEDSVLTGSGNAVAVLSGLQEKGFRIMLDDCFSLGSGIFPARMMCFSDYKLDMSVVNDMQVNGHAYSLIKSLVYYCKLTGSKCIAEGVDSQEKFDQLKAMGVHGFQGYWISLPITEELMGRAHP